MKGSRRWEAGFFAENRRARALRPRHVGYDGVAMDSGLGPREVRMRRLLIVGVLLALVGCRNYVLPFQARAPKRVDDPCLDIPEQERRGRSELPLPQQSPRVAPSLQGGDPNTFIQER
jgi:hypothetical protein